MSLRVGVLRGMMCPMNGVMSLKVLELLDRLELVRNRLLDAVALAGDEHLSLRVEFDRDLRGIALDVARLVD